MILLRSIVFNLLFYGWAAIAGILLLPTLLLSRDRVLDIGCWWSLSVMRLARAVCGIDWEIRGLDAIPEGRVIFASKHQSAWDTFLFPALFGQPAAVAKAELRYLPFYGWYTSRAGTIWVDRKAGSAAIRSLVRGAHEALARNRSIFIFPQGTRTAPGDYKPYQPGIAALYSNLDLPVVPVALNSGQFWGRRAFNKLPGKIIVQCLPAIPAGLPRAEFMKRLEAVIEQETTRLEAAADTRPQG